MSFHGGNIVATAKDLGCDVNDLIDMSSNLTPLGPVPGLHESIISSLGQIAYLPETGSETLIEKFAEKYGIKENQIMAGNGTTEFIFALPAISDCDQAVIVNPTYSDYRLACEWQQLPVYNFILKYEEQFCLNLEKLSSQLKGGELVFVCNPNNPTGVLTASSDILQCALDNPDSTFLVDESYLSFTREKSLLHYELPKNLYILCSFSKIYGIPGLRLGFIISSEENIQKIIRQRKPWGVNRVAQVSGEFLLDHGDHYQEEVVCFLEKYKNNFVQQLNKINCVDVVPGDANFILCHLREDISVYLLHAKMLKKKIMIRNCNTFEGLGDHFFRISLKDERSNNYCLLSLQEILGTE
jgi:threonine-phosphate decarboxylase